MAFKLLRCFKDMPRIPRSISVHNNFCVHKIWRGHNKEWNIGSDEQKAKYLEFMNEDMESLRYDGAADLNALTLMSNHAHEIFHINKQISFSNHMRRHHGRYGQYFNKLNHRSGKVAEDRPKTCLIADDHHEMIAVFYIHANPIRAGIVKDARNYRWSTHVLYAYGKRLPWMRNIKLPNWYLKLGRTMNLRQRRYRQLFERYLRDQGRRRQRFLQKLFFGPLLWMSRHEEKVSQWRSEHAPPSV